MISGLKLKSVIIFVVVVAGLAVTGTWLDNKNVLEMPDIFNLPSALTGETRTAGGPGGMAPGGFSGESAAVTDTAADTVAETSTAAPDASAAPVASETTETTETAAAASTDSATANTVNAANGFQGGPGGMERGGHGQEGDGLNWDVLPSVLSQLWIIAVVIVVVVYGSKLLSAVIKLFQGRSSSPARA